MAKLKQLVSFGIILAMMILPLCSRGAYADIDGFTAFETQQYYEKHVNDFTKGDWYEDYKSNKGLSDSDKEQLKGLRYYLRINRQINLDDINPAKPESDSNPDNVKRVIRLMPQANFEKIFGKAGEKCSYINFLKSVALLPGLFSNYEDFKKETGLERTKEMENPDLIAKKILAAIMANAVQETSNSGQGARPTFEQKVIGTFGILAEQENPKYNESNMGPFAPGRPWERVAKGNIYSGRGVHQITYGMNYANISLFLYGDLRLVRYPNLVISNTVLPWLTTLIYFILPQSQYPTIAEIFDGQWKRHVESLDLKDEEKKWGDRYLNEFPMCVLLINGGIECGQKSMVENAKDDEEKEKVMVANNNTMIRGWGYYNFAGDRPVEKTELFSKVSPKYDGALSGEKVLEVCHSISQNDPENTSSKGLYRRLNWYRKFFLNKSVPKEGEEPKIEPQNYYSDYMIFGGKKIERLMEKP